MTNPLTSRASLRRLLAKSITVLALLVMGRMTVLAQPVYQVNVGGDATGSFSADMFYNGGDAYSMQVDVSTDGVTNPPPAEVYQSVRALYQGAFSYVFPDLQAGKRYLVRLHFADIFSAQPGDRLFNVTINGIVALSNFDIIAEAGGPNIAIAREFQTVAKSSGEISIDFSYVKDSAIISAIEISAVASDNPDVAMIAPESGSFYYLPTNVVLSASASASSGTISKVEFFSGENKLGEDLAEPYSLTWTNPAAGNYSVVARATDSQGRISESVPVAVKVIGPGFPIYQINVGGGEIPPFAADAFFAGGGAYSKDVEVQTNGLINPAPMEVYKSMRALFEGNFSYTFPNLIPGSSYRVRLHFADLFSASPGDRIFNVGINGNPVLTNFDVIAETGAPNIAIIKEFSAAADSGGKLAISFGYVKDSAIPCAIEIIAAAAGPSILLTGPSDGATFTNGAAINIAASASASAGAISKVEFFANDTKIGEDTESPYSLSWNGSSPGTVIISAKVTDSLGTAATSPGLAVTVHQPGRAYQINTGGGAVGPFAADAFFTGGDAYSKNVEVDTNNVPTAAPLEVYKTVRALYQGSFSYLFPGLEPGSAATVRLHFADVFSAAPGDRAFNVSVNGTPALENFDIIAEAGGPNIAIVRDLPATVDAGGNIEIDFEYVVDSALPAAIEILGSRAAASANLTIGKTAGGLTITWAAPGYALEEAPAVEGPWTAVANATSPMTLSPAGPVKFYRLRK